MTLPPEPELKVSRLDGDHVALGCLEFPAGRIWWLKVALVDLPNDFACPDDFETAVSEIIDGRAAGGSKLA